MEEIGGSCPWCAAVVLPGTAVCDECGTRLAPAPEPEPEPVAVALDPRWGPKLELAAAALVLAVVALVAGGALALWGGPTFDEGGEFARHQRVVQFAGTANVGSAGVLLAAGLVLAGARRLGRRAVATGWLVVLVAVGLAAIGTWGIVEDLRWDGDPLILVNGAPGLATKLGSVLNRLAALVVLATGALLTRPPARR